MLNYRLWKDRLETELNGTGTKVGFASGIKEALANKVRLSSSIFVIPGSEDSNDLDSTATNASMTTARMDVLIVARDYKDGVGDKATDNIYTVTNAVFNALNGWTPDDASTPIHKRAAKRVGMNKGSLIWVVTYDCKYIES